MKLRNIFSIVAMMVLPSLTLTSCLSDEEDLFSQDSSNRLNEYLNETKAVLRSAPNGWVMDYYVGDDQIYGGYSYIVKFDSLTCTAMSEVTDTLVSTSYYKMSTDDGPVLTFDTYNEVLHQLATPGSTTGSYEGMHADFEFIVMSATPEEVVLKGKKTGSIMTMRPLQVPAKEYLDSVNNVVENLIVSTAEGQLGNTDVTATIDLNDRSLELAAAGDTLNTAFVYTDKGIRLYHGFDVDGKTISQFDYDSQTNQLRCTDNGTSLVLNGKLPEDYQYYENFAGDYSLSFMVEDQQSGKSTLDSIPVTLTPADNKTYKMSGLSAAYDVVLTYNKSKGALMLNTQKVADVDGKQLWINATAGGSLYPGSTSTGVMTQWNMDSEHPAYTLVSNGATVNDGPFDADGFCLWLFDDNGSVGQFTDRSSSYAFTGGRLFIGNFVSLKKK